MKAIDSKVVGFTGEKLYCGCPRYMGPKGHTILLDGWALAIGDEKVSDTPQGKVIEFHNCKKLKVWQEYKGFKKYFLIKDINGSQTNQSMAYDQ